MPRNRRTTVCREGWYFLLALGLVFTAAMLRDVNLLMVLAGMLAGTIVLSWPAAVRSLRGLRVRRKLPGVICAGDLLVTGVHLANTRRKTGCWGVVVEEQIRRDAAPVEETAVRPAVLFPYVPAGESRKGVYRGRLMQRGCYRVGPLRLSTRFPFGLLRRTIDVGQAETLTVLPRLGRLTRGWAVRRRESLAGARRRERRPGPEGDFYGIRPWRAGDGRRGIHWRTSARLGELVVRQFEQPRNRDLAVLVDLWQPERPGPEHLDRVELAVSFAATVVAELCRRGDANLLLATAGPPAEWIAGPACEALLHEAMHRLAVAEAHGEDRLPELLAKALPQIDPGTETLLVTTRPIDLEDTLAAAPRRRIRCVDTSSEELAEFFQVE